MFRVKNKKTKEKLIGAIDKAVDIINRKNNGKYIIQNDIDISSL